MKKVRIDGHVHLLPQEILSYMKKHKNSLMDRFPVADTQVWDVEQLLAEAHEANIDTFHLLGIQWPDSQMCKDHNDYSKEIMDAYPGLFYASASLNPTDGWIAVWELERCYLMGFSGVGELDPCRGSYSLSHKRFLQVMEAAHIYNMVPTINVSPPFISIPGIDDKTPIDEFYDLAKRFPDSPIILTHLGGALPYYELWPEVKEAFKHVYYDTSSTLCIYEKGAIKKVLEIVSPHKIVFGSGFPLYVGKECTTSLLSVTTSVFDQLSSDVSNHIMGANLQTLLEKK